MFYKIGYVNEMRIINVIKSLIKIRLIKIDDARNIFGKKFSTDHHIFKTVKQIQCSPRISYKQSELYKYHNNFCPCNQIDALGLDHIIKSDLPLFANPWGYSNKNKKKKLNLHSSVVQLGII